jgi:hypothetical protein
MKSNLLISILVVVVIGVIGVMAMQTFQGSKVETNTALTAIVYKSLSCGCCGAYTSYMKNEGYNVETRNISDMSTIKQEFAIPYELESCHTMEIGGYVVEGHIPEEAIVKLLTEKPDIKGIGMPGMPSGSPGMPGQKTGDFVIYEITHEGTKGDIFMTI